MAAPHTDQNLVLINAKLMAKIALLEQENEQHKQEKEQLKQQFETQLAKLW